MKTNIDIAALRRKSRFLMELAFFFAQGVILEGSENQANAALNAGVFLGR